MPRPRRQFKYNGVYFVSNRTSYGLPFVANLYLNLLLFGVLARAMWRCPGVVVCAWLFMGNHYHGVFALKADPDQAANFMHYVDGEIGKIVKKLRGTIHENVWAKRYDSTPILTADDVLEKIAYIYLNPVRANLVDSIEDYPGAHTWHEFNDGSLRKFKYVGSSKVEKLPNGAFKRKLVRAFVDRVHELQELALPLIVNHCGWTDCFEESKGWSKQQVLESVQKRVLRGEAEAAKLRKRKKISVIGGQALAGQNFHLQYRPVKFEPKALCICSCKETRKAFLEEYAEFCELCHLAWICWKLGDYRDLFPPGAFKPPAPPNASLAFS